MTDHAPPTPALQDTFGRTVNYVRLSVTDRCDLRCRYCMSEDMTFLPRAQVLTLEEFARLGRVFAGLGVSKIRVTGGEPLARSNVISLFRDLGRMEGVGDLTLTTNGTRLARFAAPLRDAGVDRINISLDTLRADRFERLARVDAFDRVMAGIDAARAAGFSRVKINSVILRRHNEDEVLPLARFALERGMDISFIEEMPVGIIDGRDRADAYYSSHRILDDLAAAYELAPATATTAGPSRYYEVAGHSGRIGLISPHSHNFCDTCNRVRVTATGRLLLCLGQEHSVDLRRELRAHPDDDEPVRAAIIDAMSRKPKGHEFDLSAPTVVLRHMNTTGG
jgi:cyclic pyranopterin phosphate synthase